MIKNKKLKDILHVFILALLIASFAVAPLGAATISPRSGFLKTIKITVTYAEFTANAQTQDITLITLPPKTAVYRVVADLTSTFSCASVCTTSTLSIKTGKTAGGAEYLTSFDADNAVTRFGDADGELGSSINAANGPDVVWTSNTVQIRMTSGTGNVGTGSATHLATGKVDFYVTYVTYL